MSQIYLLRVKFESLNNVNNAPCGLLYILVKVNKTPTLGLLDRGAVCCVISTSFFNQKSVF